jgi:hypothetical protein
LDAAVAIVQTVAVVQASTAMQLLMAHVVHHSEDDLVLLR